MKHLWSPWRMTYIQKAPQQSGCIFCNAVAANDDPGRLIVLRGQRAFVILNRYPYTSGHLMVAPYDHQPSLELLTSETRAEMMELMTKAVIVLRALYRAQGFNLGANLGEAAGAGVADHVHLHIVPRWAGDGNFMSSVGDTRVLPEALEDTYRRVKEAWE